MATYKVLQDIEAEDKFIGPFSLKQSIFLAIAIGFGYISGFMLTRGIWFIGAIFSPFIVFCLVMAWPWSSVQPTELWLLARIRFFFRPRKRVWDQTGIQELVTITVPKKEIKNHTDGLSVNEVQSRLSALAATIDSRGWAVKNVAGNPLIQTAFANGGAFTDRLLDASSLPQEVSTVDVTDSDDILDENNNRVAQNFQRLIQQSDESHRARVISQMQAASQNPAAAMPSPLAQKTLDPTQLWFMQPDPSKNAPGNTTFVSQLIPAASQPLSSGPTAGEPTSEELALLEKIHEDNSKAQPAHGHMKVVKTLEQQQQEAQQKQIEAQAAAAMTAQSNPDILRLANNDDLNVATLARQAEKSRKKEPPTNEVIVSLH